MRTSASLLAALALIAAPSLSSADIGITNFFNLGCMTAMSPANGCVLTSVKGPIAPGENIARGTKEGQACGYNILALFTWGDVRIHTAVADGDISEISSIDYKTFALIPGFYGFARHCTVVSGR